METQNCQNCKKDFTIFPDDVSYYEKIQVPQPTWCPECRLIRRLSWRNERNLYRNECALCKKSIISIIHAGSLLKVYCSQCWWGEGWDGTQHGREYDFSRNFFDQFRELTVDVPWIALQTIHTTLENSDYVNMCASSKNCYLTSHADHNEDSMYASGLKFSKQCVDVLMLNHCEVCYDSVNCTDCNKTFYSMDCQQSYEILFSKNLAGCNNCVGCVNLRNKSYCIFNEQYSKEEYKNKVAEMGLDSFENVEALKKKALDFWYTFPQKYFHGFNNSHVSGDYIYYSKNTLHSYEMVGAEDSKYCQFASTKNTRDCYDYTEWGENAELVYESIVSSVNVNNLKFCWVVQVGSNNATYSMHCFGCRNIFGCIGLRSKEYCIFNKQYTKEEYEKLVPQIIAQMNAMPYIDQKGRVYTYGEFFPPELSIYAYNETVQEFFPKTKDEVLAEGFLWKEPEARSHKITLLNNAIPDSIEQTDESIMNEIIECTHQGTCEHNCTGAFKVTAEEFRFHKAHALPIPRLCPNCRHYERTKFRNPLKLWHRTCMCTEVGHEHEGACANEFETSYAPERHEIVYCEKCYQREVM